MLSFFLTLTLLMSSPLPELSPTASAPKSKRKAICALAASLEKSAYRYGGRDKRGFDCSGFTSYVFMEAANIKLARSSSDQARQGKKTQLKKAKPGDLIFFKQGKRINHVGIVYKVGKNECVIIHATNSKGVIFDDVLKSRYWKSRIHSVRSVL